MAELREFYQENGYAVIENFLTDQQVEELRNEITRIIKTVDLSKYPIVTRTEIVSSNPEKRRPAENFWLSSNNKAKLFFEPGALDQNGKLNLEPEKALNKVGHGLHLVNDVFRKLTYSHKVKELLKSLGYKDPAVVQGQYLFKQPNIGTEFAPHMDATYLYVEPVQNLGGLWFALDDATSENGCLSFVPGSHKGTQKVEKYNTKSINKLVDKVDYRFLRNSDPEGPIVKFTGEKRDIKSEQFQAAPVKKGSCVVIHGIVMHKSEANTSMKSRHAYTFHFIETHGGANWSKENWLEENFDFPHIYDQN